MFQKGRKICSLQKKALHLYQIKPQSVLNQKMKKHFSLKLTSFVWMLCMSIVATAQIQPMRKVDFFTDFNEGVANVTRIVCDAQGMMWFATQDELVTIGSGVTIGAGSVVVSDIPDRTVAIGNPCRVIRTL